MLILPSAGIVKPTMTDAEFEEWILEAPPIVQEIARRVPMIKNDKVVCYRARSNKGHYVIHSYSRHKSEPECVTLKTIHGRDSYSPGIMVFGVEPDDMIECGCGKWEPPTEEQVAATRRKIAVETGRDPDASWFWLSFIDESQPLEQRFLGAAIVGPAPNSESAVNLAMNLGLHRGGQVLTAQIPPWRVPVIPESFRMRILTKEDVAKLDALATNQDRQGRLN